MCTHVQRSFFSEQKGEMCLMNQTFVLSFRQAQPSIPRQLESHATSDSGE